MVVIVHPKNLDLHQEILARLEAEGIITDYWVSWVGTGGKLDLAVRTDAARDIKTQISDLLEGLVPEASIIVKQA